MRYNMAMRKAGTPLVARPKRPPAVFICTKCLKKADEGRAIRQALKQGLADRVEGASRGSGKLVATKCMGVCPKRAVTLASGATLLQGELLLVKHAAEVPAVLERLLA